MIVDVHTHPARADALPEVFFDGWADNIRRLLPPELTERQRARVADRFRLSRDDPDGDLQVAEMDAAGIDVACLLLIDFGMAFPGEVATLESLYADIRRRSARHPGRFLPFAGVDPRRGTHGVRLFEQALVDWGFLGLKLYPPCGFSPSDPSLFPCYELCAAHRVPVITHTGPTSPRLSFRYTHPREIDEAARLFPGVNFILAHGAVVHRDDAALLAEYRPNVYLDTAGFQTPLGRGEWAASLAYFKGRGILRKILFGSDWPIHYSYGQAGEWLARLGGDGPLDERELRWFYQDNPLEVLRLS